jgi:hypothetical protein
MRKHKGPDVRCERCQNVMVAISLTVAERPLVMHSCSRCDRRSWSSEGQSLALGGVLDRIGATRR